jgi:hypothetical protein
MQNYHQLIYWIVDSTGSYQLMQSHHLMPQVNFTAAEPSPNAAEPSPNAPGELHCRSA